MLGGMTCCTTYPEAQGQLVEESLIVTYVTRVVS
jgi:hypothetical protein